jgi:hypothetical protein
LHDKGLVKWKIVKDMCTLLGVEHPHDLQTPVERQSVIRAANHLQQITDDLNNTFGLRISEDAKACEDGLVRRGVELANGVLRSWGFTVLKSMKKK